MKKLLNTKLKDMKAITLIALVVTIIILLILAGVTVGFAVNGSGLFEKAKLATDEYNNSVEKENYALAKLNNETDITSSRTYTETEVNELLSKYQKLRSDVFIDVTINTSTRFTAPTDGYFTIGATVKETSSYASGVKHYLANDQLIEEFYTGGYAWVENQGCTFYMKKGEYITYWSHGKTTIDFARFWYAEGEQPNE